MKPLRTLKCVLCSAAVVLVACLPAAAEVEFEIGVEDWGLGGAVKAGMWSPLYVELTARNEDFDGFTGISTFRATRRPAEA